MRLGLILGQILNECVYVDVWRKCKFCFCKTIS